MNSRLTTATMYSTLLDSLQQSQRNIQELQRQIASGNKYNRLVDNPAAVSQSLAMQSALNANAKYQQNSTNAITMLRYADGAMNNVLDAAEKIKALIVQANNGTLPPDQLQDISAQIEANKKIMLDNLNTRVAGQYIFGGTDTTTPPFVEQADGSIIYQGTNDRIKYAVSDGILGDVSFAGSDIVPTNEDSYFICSHYVPLDWTWTGREEKVQITVGNRTLSVFIPEDWNDSNAQKTNTKDLNYSDYNGYRDPGEVTGISLDDLASIINSSLQEQGADMLVKASIEKDYETGRQQMILKSNTGEKIGITGWPDTDYMPMPATITSADLSAVNWKTGSEEESEGLEGLMGNKNILGWKGSENSGTLTITHAEKTYNFDLSEINSATDLVTEINKQLPSNNDSTPFASLSSGILSGHLVLQSDSGNITVSGTNSAMSEIFGVSEELSSTSASLTVKIADNDTDTAKVFINSQDTTETLAARINSIEGIYARTSADKNRLIISAQRTGALQTDRLHIDEAQEELHYPSLTIMGEGEALNMFSFENGALKAVSERRIVDQSHMDVFDVLGMETAMKSREFSPSETLRVEDDEQLHWRIMSGGRTTDIKLNSGDYTLEELAERLKNAGAGWLEVTLSEDKADDWGQGTLDSESKTQRLVIRGYNGEQVLFLDMNAYNYADKMGLSTALRTDAYNDKTGYAGTGTKCVNFPSAPCVDDNIGVPMRVQMNCGMSYDVNIKKAEVIDKATGFVDRNKLMKSISDQVNQQEGHEIMGFTVHLDESGVEIKDSSAIYFLSGESFTVVDLPFNDPEWNDYSGGLAAQLGIHGGITGNLAKTKVPMKDNATFEQAYDAAELAFRQGTIRFSNLAHEVEIDVSATDTVKDIMDRLRVQAGDWLYVNYYDQHMGQDDTRNTGDFPLISFSSIDGSAVNVLDVKGHIAQDALGISTGIQTRLNPYGNDYEDEDEDTGIMAFDWDIENQDFPADSVKITVAGYSHTIDLRAIRDVTADDKVKADDVAEFINARMQDYDVRAEVNADNELMLWSTRGYSLKVEFSLEDYDVTDSFLDYEYSNRTYYRGGYNLEGDADTRGIQDEELYYHGIHAQNATIRSGANTMKQNGFGVINDIISAVNSGNREALIEKMIPKMDNFINNILGVMAENGALQARYSYNTDRLITEDLIMTEHYDDLIKVDPAEAISQLLIADYMYQANLAVISRLIQPSLLDFLR